MTHTYTDNCGYPNGNLRLPDGTVMNVKGTQVASHDTDLSWDDLSEHERMWWRMSTSINPDDLRTSSDAPGILIQHDRP